MAITARLRAPRTSWFPPGPRSTSAYHRVTSVPVRITGTLASQDHRGPSRPAMAPHPTSHTTYCGENTGAKTSSAATAASAGAPAGVNGRRRASSQIATTVTSVAASRAGPAPVGTVPVRFAPASNRCSPVSAHTTTPTVDSSSQPVAPRNVPTWRNASAPPIRNQPATPAISAIAAVRRARAWRSIASAGATTIGQSLTSAPAASEMPPARSRPRAASARPPTARATATRSLRR